jgi:DNA-binding transcriptional LysR family regulator
MDLRQFRYFVALAEARNFRRAAERLNMSQPPLTVAIRKLEEEVGTALFERGPRGVELTAAGASALPAARAALIEAERFRAAAREGARGEVGELRIGFVGSATFELLPRLVPRFRHQYPMVELALEEASSVEIARRLQARELDIGFVRLPLREVAAIETRLIDHDELHLAVHTSSRFSHQDVVALEALAGEPFVLQSRISVLHAISLTACHDAGFVPLIALEAPQLNAVLSLVRSGLGVALVPARAATAAPQGVKLIRLECRVPIETGLALPAERPTRPARNFASLIDQVEGRCRTDVAGGALSDQRGR